MCLSRTAKAKFHGSHAGSSGPISSQALDMRFLCPRPTLGEGGVLKFLAPANRSCHTAGDGRGVRHDS